MDAPQRDEIEVAGVRLTHPDRLLYPEQGVTKLDLARYYEGIASWILPYVQDRPLSVVRCPQGQKRHCFYQKHVTDSLPDAIHAVEIQEQDGTAPYIVVQDLAGLIALVQIGALEIHPWNCRTDSIEKPDMLVMDLDPAPDVEWAAVVEAAQELRAVFDELELSSFVRTTGGKGLHVVVPIERRSKWDDAKGFARAVAERLVRQRPDRYLSQASKEKRRGKIFLDYLRNGRGATSVASYSTRAKAGAPVATPLRWDELGKLSGAGQYDISSIPPRLRALPADPWEGFFAVRQSLSTAKRRRLGG